MLFSVVTDLRIAIDKPKGITSAQVVRDLQDAFQDSNLFAPWLAAEKANREHVNHYQQRRRRDKRLNVKIGHGGTLDPLATGVLIIGVGTGTKQLQRFLACTKSYEAVLLFGTATDTYDVLGKVLFRASYSHITRQLVEKALERFRGQIMQRPPVYSALSVQGKRLYEYAREGKKIPVEILERPVNVENIEIVEWLGSGSHNFQPPGEDAGWEEKQTAGRLLHLDETDVEGEGVKAASIELAKRKRAVEDKEDDFVSHTKQAVKRLETGSKYLMSGGLQPALSSKEIGISHDLARLTEPFATIEEDALTRPGEESVKIDTDLQSSAEAVPSAQAENGTNDSLVPPPNKGPPAVKIRMKVTSGFYVRSLCHDLGKALGSYGIMVALSRTRQGDFELGKNVMLHDQLGKGEEVWGPEVERMLDAWDKDEPPKDGP